MQPHGARVRFCIGPIRFAPCIVFSRTVSYQDDMIPFIRTVYAYGFVSPGYDLRHLRTPDARSRITPIFFGTPAPYMRTFSYRSDMICASNGHRRRSRAIGRPAHQTSNDPRSQPCHRTWWITRLMQLRGTPLPYSRAVNRATRAEAVVRRKANASKSRPPDTVKFARRVRLQGAPREGVLRHVEPEERRHTLRCSVYRASTLTGCRSAPTAWIFAPEDACGT
ncbi:hypothetical protein DSM100685_1448 [Bifidobacterium avesanii]|nr:hypothetical protein DSM100685_1448 [Bifidobacterium avesanii]